VSAITIVMYHYVRDTSRSRYPDIKALPIDDFRRQVARIKADYTVISGDELVDIVRGAEPPPKAALLTFDDGYSDHFSTVFPILDDARVPACFFPVVRCVEGTVLDVNKIQFVLASAPVGALIDAIRMAAGPHFRELWEEWARPGRYDSAEVMFVKRMLQRALPDRERLIVELFRRYVTTDEAAFAAELYMSRDQLKTLRRHGMYVGAHGYSHCWLAPCERAKSAEEIDRSVEFLDGLIDPAAWIMCYPYGGHDIALHEVVRERGGVAALTIEPAIADLRGNPLTLARLDANDLQ
jgi:peptidoglycan/xylan/chitin deacetylase (PgdA/CDA1 family)